jgi:hypothetical protein
MRCESCDGQTGTDRETEMAVIVLIDIDLSVGSRIQLRRMKIEDEEMWIKMWIRCGLGCGLGLRIRIRIVLL